MPTRVAGRFFDGGKVRIFIPSVLGLHTVYMEKEVLYCMISGWNYGDVQYIWKKWFCIVCFWGRIMATYSIYGKSGFVLYVF